MTTISGASAIKAPGCAAEVRPCGISAGSNSLATVARSRRIGSSTNIAPPLCAP